MIQENKKRSMEICVISDLHLGTIGCRAEELLQYLNSIDPQMLILNGDIIDIWQFNKRYWPKSHMLVIKKVVDFITKGVQVYYLTGNHDETLRKFSDVSIGNFHLRDKLVLEVNGKKTWFFHGDVFDVTMKYSKWLAKLGAIGYDTLIWLNSMVNLLMVKMGREKLSFSKKIKNSVKSAIKFINDFEEVAADLAIENKYHYVACGHIHQPNIKEYQNDKGSVLYLNSGDWIENLTALEMVDGQWTLYQYEPQQFDKVKFEDVQISNDFMEKFEPSFLDEVLLFANLVKAS